MSCNECSRWIRNEDWSWYERPVGSGKRWDLVGAPPCHRCPKVPKDAPARHPAYAVELSERNTQAYWHYRQCAATGRFPEDKIVARNAAVIADIVKQADGLPVQQLLCLLGGKL